MLKRIFYWLYRKFVEPLTCPECGTDDKDEKSKGYTHGGLLPLRSICGIVG